jgi:hypothetical protein
MQSKTVSLSQVLQIGRFEPAKVQREYQWRTIHVEKLLNDLVAAFQRMGGETRARKNPMTKSLMAKVLRKARRTQMLQKAQPSERGPRSNAPQSLCARRRMPISSAV